MSQTGSSVSQRNGHTKSNSNTASKSTQEESKNIQSISSSSTQMTCSFCKRDHSAKERQDFCDCSICNNCMRAYFLSRLRRGSIVHRCPNHNSHRIYMDDIMKAPFYASILQEQSNASSLHSSPSNQTGNPVSMLAVLVTISFGFSSVMDLDRCFQIFFALLIVYFAKAKVNTRASYYFIYAMYIPIVYWLVTKRALDFIVFVSPLHVFWFTIVHLEPTRATKIRVFFVWVASLLWQIIIAFLRYNAIPYFF